MVKSQSFVLLFIWLTEYVSRRKTLAILLSFQNFTFVFYSLTVLLCSFSGSPGLLQTSCTGYCLTLHTRMTFSLLRTCHTENHILYLLVKSLAQFNLYNNLFIFFICPSFHSVWCRALNLNHHSNTRHQFAPQLLMFITIFSRCSRSIILNHFQY